ncbi:MAG: endopeptidase [Caproiciproducens sp.]|nr:endopeptidase [Caproiciproducens sp.]
MIGADYLIFRTDLALENTEPSRHVKTEQDGCVITRIDEDGNTYITLEVKSISDHLDSSNTLLKLTAQELSALLPESGEVLVAGLGNRAITPDALGPLTAEKILATRHIKGELARVTGLDKLRPVAVVSPGVLGCTGIEAFELLKALVKEFHPAVVVAIDALAARSPARLGCTIQLCTAGISPGAGVGNSRPRIDESTLGTPVISMGIPTVVDAATLAADLLGGESQDAQETVEPRGAAMMVTPREIDLIISRGARLLGMGINVALNPSLSIEEFEELT